MPKPVLLLVILLFSAPIQSDEELRYDVAGVFTLTEDGTVADLQYSSDPPAVLEEFVSSAISAWRFEPVLEDSTPVRVRVRFDFDIIGKPDGDDVIISLGEASYSEVSNFFPISTPPPSYPHGFVGTGVQVAVVVEFRAGPDGAVTDVHTARIGIVHGEHLRARTREQILRIFARASERAISEWQFSPPPNGVYAWGRYTIDFSTSSGWISSTATDNTDWYEMPTAPWRLDGGERTAELSSGNAGEYVLGDARIRRLPDVAPGA